MAKDQKIKVYLTQYALTTGIIEKVCEYDPDFPDMVTDSKSAYTQHYSGEGKNWHRTKEYAERRAEEMRRAKLKSLRKQIDKLQNITIQIIKK